MGLLVWRRLNAAVVQDPADAIAAEIPMSALSGCDARGIG
jgi:hypothetical protein